MFSNQLLISERCFEIFITQDAFDEMAAFDITVAGISKLYPPYLIERVEPNEHTLLFTSKGCGKFTSTEAELPIEPETMTIIPANTSWRFEIDSDSWDMCWLILPPTPKWNALMPAIGEVHPTAQALNVFHLCHVIDQERNMDKAFRVQSFAKLAQYLELNLSAKAPKQQERLTRAFAQVEQSLHKPWTVPDLAKLTFYSEPHFYRLVQQRYGMSPKKLIRQMRIERAMHLLEQTNWPISELAARLGFSDQFNFSNSFRAYAGVSPMRWRKDKQQEKEHA